MNEWDLAEHLAQCLALGGWPIHQNLSSQPLPTTFSMLSLARDEVRCHCLANPLSPLNPQSPSPPKANSFQQFSTLASSPHPFAPGVIGLMCTIQLRQNGFPIKPPSTFLSPPYPSITSPTPSLTQGPWSLISGNHFLNGLLWGAPPTSQRTLRN